jgi:hypothetical protein
MYSENLSISAVKANLFDKRTVVELNEGQMVGVDGGTSPLVAEAIWMTIQGVVMGVALVKIARHHSD